MIPERFGPQMYALMRIVFGLVFLMYGVQKFGMLGGVDGQGASAPFLSYPFGIAGAIEVIVGILLIIGFGVQYAAFLGAGEMAVAYFTYHVPMGSFLPVQNMGQAAVLFCFAFLYMAARGAGIWSVDGGARR